MLQTACAACAMLSPQVVEVQNPLETTVESLALRLSVLQDRLKVVENLQNRLEIVEAILLDRGAGAASVQITTASEAGEKQEEILLETGMDAASVQIMAASEAGEKQENIPLERGVVQVMAASEAGEKREVATEVEADQDSDEQFRSQASARRSVLRTSTRSGMIEVALMHSLKPSLWDSCIILGLPQVGVLGSLMLASGTVLAFSLQSVFCYIVFAAFLRTDSKYNIDAVAGWRVTVGHNVDHVDLFSKASLVSKVCNGELFDREHWQHALLDETASYLQSIGSVAVGSSELNILDDGVVVGSVLAFICILLWAAYIAKEISATLKTSVAVLRLPKGQTAFSRFGGLGEYTFDTISLPRTLVMVCTSLCRLAIAIALGIVGGLWLSLTKSIGDVLLNAAALLFIFDIDELLFGLLAPSSITVFMASLRPLENGTKKYWHGIDLSGLLRVVILAVVTGVVVVPWVVQSQKEAANLRAVLCGGNLDFVYAFDSLGGLMMTETPAYVRPDRLKSGPGKVLGEVVSRRIHGMPFENPFQALESDNLDALLDHRSMSADQLLADSAANFVAKYPKFCYDVDDGFDPNRVNKAIGPSYRLADKIRWMWSSLRYLTSQEITRCREAAGFCSRTDLPLLRHVCPETCGCLDPLSGQQIRQGCWSQCEDDPAFKDKIAKSRCEDVTPQHAHWENWRNFWQQEVSRQQAATQALVYRLELLGTTRSAAIGEGRDGRPATLFCPQTCACGSVPNVLQTKGIMCRQREDCPLETWCPSTC
eukprot:TRINITY_DN4010_c0_g1_i1.p1 TRINITY_DN4010_c0_g1~~TRINITY_DN4010_c0_g1_i1.p1  ORF type:complete len:769 (-),score=103.73 TRINITY_DN4010_c0_g1_i1:162-2468(-)